MGLVQQSPYLANPSPIIIKKWIMPLLISLFQITELAHSFRVCLSLWAAALLLLHTCELCREYSSLLQLRNFIQTQAIWEMTPTLCLYSIFESPLQGAKCQQIHKCLFTFDKMTSWEKQKTSHTFHFFFCLDFVACATVLTVTSSGFNS